MELQNKRRVERSSWKWNTFFHSRQGEQMKTTLLLVFPFLSVRKSVEMLILVGIMLSLKYVMRACKRRSRSVTTIYDCCWRRVGLPHVLTSPWTSSMTSTIGFYSPPRPAWKPCVCRWVWLGNISLNWYLHKLSFIGNGYCVWTVPWSDWTV